MSSESIDARQTVLDKLSRCQLDIGSISSAVLSREGLMDVLLAFYEECCRYDLQNNSYVSAFVKKYSATISELRKLRLRASDFEVKDVIGRGHFGDVQVVRDKHCGTVYAMKTLRKHDTLMKSEVSFYEEERDIMAKATSPWITKLHFAFQDTQALYLIMEFHAGGDLLSLLSRHDDIFEEKMARFYLAEITLAVNDLHLMGYVHRDIKPENVLIDCTGHIKLADFGSAAKLSADGLVSSQMPVGTPDYVSPELLDAINYDSVNTYGREVDWWSLGVCMYEMLHGRTPFTDEAGSMVTTYSNIMNYKSSLQFPNTPFISTEAIDLIKSLLRETKLRLDYSGIRKHAFFRQTQWEKMRSETPPFVPQLDGLDDTSNFEEFEKIKTPLVFEEDNDAKFSGKDLPFVGFTYSQPIAQANCPDKRVSEVKVCKNVRQSLDVGDVNQSIRELHRLREKCRSLEESECALKATVEHLKFELSDREDMVDRLGRESQTYQLDLETYIAKCNRLDKQIAAMLEERATMEVMQMEFKCMSRETELLETELHTIKVEELEEVINQLQEEKGGLLRKLSQRDKQVATYKEQLESVQKQAATLQFRIDKERRKSTDYQRRDLALLESQGEKWRAEMEDKVAEIAELAKRVNELEDLLEAYEGQEKEFIQREQELTRQLAQCSVAPFPENLDIRVHVRASSSPQKDRRMSDKIRDLECDVERLEKEKEVWDDKEHEYTDTIQRLKGELDAQVERARVGSEVREMMAAQVHQYQQDVLSQRQVIQELKESVAVCLSENTEEKTQRQDKLATQIKELEEQIDSYRDNKRRLLAEVNQCREEVNDQKFKVTELERTTSRQSCKIERLERQLEKAREKEINLRLNRRELSDIRIKLAEERVADVEKEKIKLDHHLKEVTKELNELRDKQMDLSDKAQSTTSKVMVENFELKTKLDDMNRSVEKMEKQITKCERNITDLEEDVAHKNKELGNLKNVRTEKLELEKKIMDLEFELKQKEKKIKESSEKDLVVSKLEREKENLETKMKSIEKELEEMKCREKSVTTRRSRLEDVEDLKQEKRFLESRVSSLQRQVEEGDRKKGDLEKQLSEAANVAEKLKVVSEELCEMKKENTRLQDSLQSERADTERRLKSQSNRTHDLQVAEENLEKERQKNDVLRAALRKELHDSNLSLSEARALLSATQRQEKATKERLEGEVRELKQRIFVLEKEKGDVEEKTNKSKEEEAVSARIASQCAELEKQVREGDERLAGLQREKAAGLMERQLLRDSLAQAENKYTLEAQKVEKYKAICLEMESQIRDLECLISEHEGREAEWGRERVTYERAMEERENDLEGAQQRLNVLTQFRQTSADMAQTVKEQLQEAHKKHKADIETLNSQIAQIRKDTERQALLITELENQNKKLHMIVDQQKVVMDTGEEEKRRLKEEISKVLTENQEVKRSNLKLRQNLEEAVDKLELIFGEKIDLENFTEALQGLHFLEKYRFESTIDQQMKLIDYLQALWQDSVEKKKKKGGKFFSKGGKETLGTLPVMGDMQTALENEAKKSRQLQEQLDRLRSENYAQASELLKLKGALREKSIAENVCMTPNIKAAVSVRITSVDNPPLLTPSLRKSDNPPLLTPSLRKSSRALAMPPPVSTPHRIQHKIPHRFVSGLNTRATKCGVCLGSVPFVNQAAKCQECHMVCHVKCSTVAQETCGIPTEYMRHFSAINGSGAAPDRHGVSDGSSAIGSAKEGVHLAGWLKVPKSSKQPGWEKRWVKLENNILFLYHEETDASPTDTLDLAPLETDVTVHSAISTAELPSLAQTDLPYVFRIEHEPLTTCWPGRVVYLMAPGFPEKQRWVASLEATIKQLQRGDTVRRAKLESMCLLDLTGDQRLELNCSLLLSKQLTLVGADEGLFAVNVTREPPVLTKLNTFDSVHDLKFVPELSLIVLIAGKERKLLTIDKKLIQLRLGQSNGEETLPVHHTVLDNIVGCTVFDIGMSGDAIYLIVGLTEKVLVMKYNPDLRQFCVRKELSVDEPCSCVCLVDGFAVVGTDRFYKIALEHPSLTEFVDKKDTSLAFAAFGAANHHSYPLAIVRVSPDGLPLEFLLCFHEFGVYVDNKGRRSRPADLKWSCLPLSLAYKEPFLYVTYFTSVQAITVPASKQEIRGKQTSLDLTAPRYLGAALEPGTVFVASSSGVSTQLLSIKGKDRTSYEPALGKENRPGGRSTTKGDKLTQSPSKPHAYKVNKYKSSGRACQRLSLTSIDSNSSVSSTSTVSSHSSQQTDI
ncbi:citron Rho-interacting kinase-like isoform X2 [Dreissena polymorpha]|uniref:citron Rho-interacting kinase-like isoform X2 n=1 Tax=Dreissena polymorpha TaxID=45954 RepID=UPI002264EF72|nr:citron Rho-interacting kinase-like isoform X2 [Dreissena polymorpha]